MSVMHRESDYLVKKYLETKIGRIFYFTNISHLDNRPTIVFLHGLSSNHTTWLNIMSSFVENGYNVIAPDIRGHGFSSKNKIRRLYSFSRLADDMESILKQERATEVVVVGYSFG